MSISAFNNAVRQFKSDLKLGFGNINKWNCQTTKIHFVVKIGLRTVIFDNIIDVTPEKNLLEHVFSQLDINLSSTNIGKKFQKLLSFSLDLFLKDTANFSWAHFEAHSKSISHLSFFSAFDEFKNLKKDALLEVYNTTQKNYQRETIQIFDLNGEFLKESTGQHTIDSNIQSNSSYPYLCSIQ